MTAHIIPEFTIANGVGAIVVAFIYIALSSLIREPQRQKFSAVMLAGAGAAYLSGGLGLWEFPFCFGVAFIAFKGLNNYKYIALGWVLHTLWDIAHHLYGNPIVFISPSSSAGCAVCDSILAIWFFFNAPNVFDLFKGNATLSAK